VPEAATTCLFNTLQESKHQVRTAFGNLDTHFGGNDIIPITSILFSGFSFVDDINTIQTACNPAETWREVIQGLQHSLKHWEGGLRATGGAIVPEKNGLELNFD